MRIVLIVVAALFGIPLLVTTGLQLYAAILVADVAMDVNSSMTEAKTAADATPSTAYPVENVKADRALQAGYNALARLDQPLRDRSIRFTAYVSTSELLQDGEKAPGDDFADVFVAARAAPFAEAECGRVLETIASHCTVISATAAPVKSEKGRYVINVMLGFVQKDALGDVPADTPLAYREITANLTSAGRKWVTAMPFEASKQRRRFYDEAARQCRQVRKTEGNCALYQIVILTQTKRGSTALELTGRAQLSFLQRAADS